MKTKLFLFYLFVCVQVYSQNPVWVFPPNYLLTSQGGSSATLPLPTGPSTNDPMFPFDYYDGKPAKFASNGIADLNGELKFFIVDGLIYGKDGEFKSFVNGNSLPNYELTFDELTQTDSYEFTLSSGSRIAGGSGFTIVPHPVTCGLYYIFYTVDEGVSFKNTIPKYALYDDNEGIILKSAYWYDNADCSNNTNENDEIFSVCSPVINSDLPVSGGLWGEEYTRSSIGDIVATDTQPDGSRFVLWAGAVNLYILKIDNEGNIFYWKRHAVIPRHTYSIPYRSETELYYDSQSNTFKIAFAGYNQGGGGLTAGSYLSIYHLSASMLDQVSLTYNVHLPWVPQGGIAFVKGLEFSEDGTKLFFTHTTNNVNFPELLYVDFNTDPYQINPLFANTDLRNSFIERKGNKLYFATSTGLHTLTDSNNPDELNFSVNAEISLPIQGNDGTLVFTDVSTFAYVLPDQIDDMDYSLHLEITQQCCVENSRFDIQENIQISSATWQPGLNNNPFTSGNTIFVKDEMRIPAGVTLTIENMRVLFAPQAKVIIENGENGLNGGRLRLVGTTMTVDERCGSDLWQGIEVWGNQDELQGTPSNSKQGVLEILAGSKIENAHMGVLVSKVNTVQMNNDDQIIGFTFDDSYNGGLVIASNSTFTNNATGVYFRKYLPTGVVNNRSKFNNMTFDWTGLLKRPNFFISAHMELEETRGITISGCHFKNSNPQVFVSNFSSEYAIGSGVISRGSHIYVQADCADLTQPCNNPIPSIFKNLHFGILGQQVQLQTINVEGCEFINNIHGISVSNSLLARVVKNKFQVRGSQDIQTSGLTLINSSRYIVQENSFQEDINTYNGTSKSHGIVAVNSGITNNDIYKNLFMNLYVGGQSEKINAREVSLQNLPNMPNFQMSGLTWTCNTFRDQITKADLTVDGRINFFQGKEIAPDFNLSIEQRNEIAVKNAARNVFSMVGEASTNIDHDIMMTQSSQGIRYVHLSNINHIPDAYTFTKVIPILAMTSDDGPASMIPNGCPSKIRPRVTVTFNDLLAQQTSIKEQITAIDSRLKSGSELLTLVQQVNNVSTIKNQLMAQSPYLSDEVMIAYMDRNPAAGHLKEVLVSNSPLTEPVKGRMMSMSIPVGIKNQILQAQNTNKVSVRQNAVWSKLQLEHEKDLIYNERLSLALMDTSATATMDLFIEILKEDEALSKDRERLKLLLETYISKGDRPSIDELLSEVIQDAEIAQEEKELFVIEDEIRFKEATCVALAESPEIRSKLELWNEDETAPLNVKRKSKCILEIADKSVEMQVFEEVMPSSAMALMNSETATVYSEYETISAVYPNPTSGEIFIDYPFEEEGTLLVHVYSINGQLVHSISKQSTNGEKIDLSHLNNGLYLLEVLLDGEKLGTHKVQIK